MVPRNASHARSRLPPPPLLPELLVPLVLFVPLVVGSLTVSPPPLEVVPLDVLGPVVESEEVEAAGATTRSRHDAVATSALIWLRLHEENWLL